MRTKNLLIFGLVAITCLSIWLGYKLLYEVQQADDFVVSQANFSLMGIDGLVLTTDGKVNLAKDEQSRIQIYTDILQVIKSSQAANQMVHITSREKSEMGAELGRLYEIFFSLYLQPAKRLVERPNDSDIRIITDLGKRLKKAGFPTKQVQQDNGMEFGKSLQKFLNDVDVDKLMYK